MRQTKAVGFRAEAPSAGLVQADVGRGQSRPSVRVVLIKDGVLVRRAAQASPSRRNR